MRSEGIAAEANWSGPPSHGTWRNLTVDGGQLADPPSTWNMPGALPQYLLTSVRLAAGLMSFTFPAASRSRLMLG
jgi:hypothetical protein